MFIYYLYCDDEFLEVEEKFFKNLINLFSEKFGIYKFDINFNATCENDISFDEPLYYYLRDKEKNKFLYFGCVYKINI